MNALQKRLEEIGTEPHENGLRDAIVYKDAKDQCYWIYNHYSHAGVSREEVTEKLAQNSLFTAPPKDLENLLFYAWACVSQCNGNKDATPCYTNGLWEEYDAWYKQTKEKYRLNEEYEMIKFKD